MSALSGPGGAAAPVGVGLDAPEERTSSFADLTSEQFFELVMTELQNQDPSEPQDTQALLDQISTLSTMEAESQTLEKLDRMIEQGDQMLLGSDFVSAAGLIGALVEGSGESGQAASGLVSSVSRSGEQTVLNLADGSRMALEDVRRVDPPPPATDPPDDPSAGPADDPDDDPEDREQQP